MQSTDEKEILSLIQKEFPSLNPSDSLQQQMSSLEMVDLVMWLEKSFQIEVHSFEYDQKVFFSLQTISQYVKKKILKTT